MVRNSRHNCLSGVAGEVIVTKSDVLESGLLGDELREKVSIPRSFLLRVRVLEPR